MLPKIVSDAFPSCKLTIGSNGGDNRSYRVSFEKIKKVLPKFKSQRDATTGARQFKALFEKIGMDEEVFSFRPFTRLKQIEHLIRTRQLDQSLFWT